MESVKGGVTAPAGFSAAGVSCGIKKRGKDLALIYSAWPAAAAGTLTRNRLRAPSVDWTERALRLGRARAVVANSGNANCCTGRRGARDTEQMARRTAQRLWLRPEEVLAASTGVIGRFLPMDRVLEGIDKAVRALQARGSLSAAEAIMTTDTRAKEMAVEFRLGGIPVRIGGIAKGSGMIAPRMATMLCFLTTDAAADAPLLRRTLRECVERSFNAISVDGETSTNDMVLLLANGASGAPRLRPGTRGQRDFTRALDAVCRTLAHEIVRDGEGVNRLMSVAVTGASDASAARRVAERIANSALVKTMVAGRDPNWGRVAAAVGASGVPFRPERLTIRLGGRTVFRAAEPVPLPRETLLEQVDRPEVRIQVDLGQGGGQAHLLSGDLTEGYIRINAKYTS